MRATAIDGSRARWVMRSKTPQKVLRRTRLGAEQGGSLLVAYNKRPTSLAGSLSPPGPRSRQGLAGTRQSAQTYVENQKRGSHQMKLQIAAAVLTLSLAGAAHAADAEHATDYVTIPLETTVKAPADVVWKKVGGFCDIGGWMHTTCVITSGGADVGAVRRIAGRVDEVLVSKTAWSYTYAQPKSPIDYHGTVEVRPDGKTQSKLIYTLVYDAAALKDPTPDGKAKDVAGRTKMFTGVLNTMKTIAETK
ncbi:MAG: SRPBCC family protein [Phenylobacterium sp.]|nr:MAG: SRPBCC family protein [Phenylobacterium sp.]